MQKVVVFLALGDKYWANFASYLDRHFPTNSDIRLLILHESRLGEYQLFLRRAKYRNSINVYLSDYAAKRNSRDSSDQQESKSFDKQAVFCDYLRLTQLGEHSARDSINWRNSAILIQEFANDIFNRYEVLLTFGDTPSTAFNYIFSKLCNQSDIPYWGITGSRIPGRFSIVRGPLLEGEDVLENYRQILSGNKPPTQDESEWAEQYLKNFSNQIPDYMLSARLNSTSIVKFLNVKYLRSILGTFAFELCETTPSINRARPLRSMFTAAKRNVVRSLRKKGIIRSFFQTLSSEIELESIEDSYIYAMHYQPEASTVVNSSFYCNQSEIIRNLSFSLPDKCYLLVKEHISNIAFLPYEFYAELNALPNVILISPYTDIKSLIPLTKGVITLTGTVGHEAIILDKPVYIFGRTFYEFHDLCYRLSDWNAVTKELQTLKAPSMINKKNYLISYRRTTFAGTLNFDEHDFNIGKALLENIMIEATNQSSKG